MASANSISADDIERLQSDGLLDVKDSGIGEQVQRMKDGRFPVRKAEGLNFCKRNILDDTRVRQVLETCFDWCGLGIYKVFGSDPTHIYVFMNCPNAEMSALTVQLWGAGSQIEYYVGLQFLELNTLDSSTGLLEVPSARLAGRQPVPVEMEHGGMYARHFVTGSLIEGSDLWYRVIADARLAFRIVKGLAIMFVFATKEELAGWAKMELRKGRGLELIVDSMERPNVGVNFTFQD
jgi:hypothetical protein